MKRKKIITILLITIAVVLSIISYLVLPETLIMQIGFDGTAGNSLPKLIGIALETFMTIGGAIAYYKSDENGFLFLSIIGLASYFIVFWFNLFM